MGSLGGGKESESNFLCPTCSQPLSAAQVFTGPALKKARGQAEGSQHAAGAGQAKDGWHSSSKVEHLLELLRGMQQRGTTGYDPDITNSSFTSHHTQLVIRSGAHVHFSTCLFCSVIDICLATCPWHVR